jgi:1-pyrroline-5-carboxylate dehydrogenase
LCHTTNKKYMATGFFNIPAIENETVLQFAPGSVERTLLQAKIAEMRAIETDIPMVINGQEVRTGRLKSIHPPHNHLHQLGHWHEGTDSHVHSAINGCLQASKAWASLDWEQRSAIFLKAADLSAKKYRWELLAATMLCQSKNAYQAEIDAACEWIDFLRYNCLFASQIYAQQPISADGVWNRSEYRPLEGFVFAVTPFNFTAIAGNLPVAAAIMGNVVLWKPAPSQVYSAHVIMKILMEAGLPAGVINMVFTDGPTTGDIVFTHPQFAGVHFTGSTGVFKQMWKKIGENINIYNSYPRIVGETGGKDFVWAHPSAHVKALTVGLLRGAFEYQGQKCSAASRAYIPANIWPDVQKELIKELKTMKMGGTEDFSNFINAVIDERSFDKIKGYLDRAQNDPDIRIIAGGNADKSKGYFIEPTVLLTTNPSYATMCEELFGPVLTIYVYETDQWQESLNLVDGTSPYALTGAVFAQDRYAIDYASKVLVNAAGNFYINDKPTGAIVGQQPFGGARASGTNDKAGSMLNLLRWTSPRTIKESLLPPIDYRYPFLGQ